MSEQKLPYECGIGQQLHRELQQQDTVVRQSRQRMNLLHQEQDSVHRQVPRAMHDALRSQTNQRAMIQMQWDRHRSACPQCNAAEARMQMAA